MLTPRPCSTMEMMTVSLTCVSRMIGVTPQRSSARMMSRWKPSDGIRNSCPSSRRTSRLAAPPVSKSRGRITSRGSGFSGVQSSVLFSWRLAKAISTLPSFTQRYTSSTEPICTSTPTPLLTRRNCSISSGSQCMAMLA